MNAYMNHGRWVADCATPYCHEAHLVTPGDGFVCGNCSQDHGDVVFPEDMALIGAALERRIVPETRNWSPPETVADLVAENELHKHEGVVA